MPGAIHAAAVSYAAPQSFPSNQGSPVSDKLLDAYDRIANAVSAVRNPGEPHIMSAALTPGGDLRETDLIVGVSIGAATGAGSGLMVPGEPLLRLYLNQDIPFDNVAELAAAAYGVENLHQVGFEVVHTGPIDAFSHRMHMRPAPCGISCGHFQVSAGTLGALARGRQQPRSDQFLILSNNHVLANVNSAQQYDDVLQPGAYDGGVPPTHVLARLERYVKIDFAQPNFVDCATAEVLDSGSVRREQLFLQNGQPAFFACGTNPVPAHTGMSVGKSGRTTQLTAGRVTGTGATIRVNMGGGRIAVFRDQIEIRGLTGLFSQPGDSGSLIWTWDSQRNPVGLLFAGGGGLTFANPIHHVLNALDIDLR